jgi:hypothetical protein
MILIYLVFLIFVNFVDFSTGLRIDAESGNKFQEEVGLQGRGLGRYSSSQRTMKYQKDKEGQLKKVKNCTTLNPLVILGGFWEHKRGRMILRCKDGRRPSVKIIALCDTTVNQWDIDPSPSSFSSLSVCKHTGFLKPQKQMSLKPPKKTKRPKKIKP